MKYKSIDERLMTIENWLLMTDWLLVKRREARLFNVSSALTILLEKTNYLTNINTILFLYWLNMLIIKNSDTYNLSLNLTILSKYFIKKHTCAYVF